MALKVLIQQISSGLYWKSGVGWVKGQDEADGFETSNRAILFCIAGEMRDTRVVLSFGDPNLDVILHPFGERGHERTSGELIDQSRAMKEKSKGLLERARAMLAGTLQSIAAWKEARKKVPFKRKSDDEES